jgi:hypothetical protein
VTAGAGACTGTYQGTGTVCNPNPCGGACCTGNVCTVTIASACPSGSIFVDHGVCDANACHYCVAGSATCGTTNDDERIAHFTFNTIDNDSGTGDGPAGCYTDFTSISTTVYPGQTYAVTLTNAGVYAADQSAIWIDFNKDFVLGDVASGEQIPLVSTDGGATFTGSVTIPTGAALGSNILRARVMYTGAVLSCGNATFGEVEDYGLTIAVATNGACCQASGACTETLPGGCVGTFSGVGTSCAPVNVCGGACCDTAGNCSVTTVATCASGNTFTNGGVCTATYCNGACCDSSGVCTLAISAAACTGTFSGARTSCSPNPCPGQSCASPIALTVNVTVPGDLALSVSTSTISCSTGTHGLWYSFTAPADGTYAFNSTQTSGTGNPSLGLFGPCGTELACANPCGGTSTSATLAMTSGQQVVFRAGGCGDVQLTYNVTVSIAIVGACCNDTSGACNSTAVGAAGCAPGTTYMGVDSVCSAALCGQGACCNDATSACTLTTAVGCTVGTFQTAGSICGSGVCPTVACCDAATGACTIVGPTGTCPGTSTSQGPGTSCTPNVCPQPPTGACCNSSTGACSQVIAANCPATTSTYSGDNTTCAVSGFCAGIGTCCSSLGNCMVIYAGSCPGGLTPNASLTCTANLCPAVGPHTCENFDSGSAGSLPLNWTSTTTGAGAAWVIDTAQSNSAPNAVFTNDVASVSSQFLVLPSVVSGASGLTLDFLSSYDTEATFDGWVVEFSTDGGGSWTDIAVGGTWVLNGYNQAAISANWGSPIGGRPAFSGVFTAWTTHIATIPTGAGQSVIIRFQMASDESVSHAGVWLDDIRVGGLQLATGGVCCRGSTCSTSFADAVSCAAATPAHLGSTDPFYKFVSTSTVCNSGVNADGTYSAGLTSTTTPCCFANYNHNATLEVQDIFDFLNDWFAGRAIAIPGGDGTSTTGLAVQNIFNFLNAWFAGGCL